jgi:hypothetical protein
VLLLEEKGQLAKEVVDRGLGLLPAPKHHVGIQVIPLAAMAIESPVA